MNPIYLIPTDDPRVKTAAEWLAGQFVGVKVKYYDYTTAADELFGGSSPDALPEHVVMFTDDNGKVYVAAAGLLAMWPRISVGEMKAIGFVPKA